MRVYICDHCRKSITSIDKIKMMYKQWSDDKEPKEFIEICIECFWKLEQWAGKKREPWMTFYNEKIKPAMDFKEIDMIYAEEESDKSKKKSKAK